MSYVLTCELYVAMFNMFLCILVNCQCPMGLFVLFFERINWLIDWFIDWLICYDKYLYSTDDIASVAVWPQLKELFAYECRLDSKRCCGATPCTGLVMAHKGTKMTDNHFENLVSLKSNTIQYNTIQCSFISITVMNNICHQNTNLWWDAKWRGLGRCVWFLVAFDFDSRVAARIEGQQHRCLHVDRQNELVLICVFYISYFLTCNVIYRNNNRTD